ncbi:thymidylate synthase [Candidatus Woesearchaeota archaeon]|nr:thymidylate synthase [Candidatus Woesearchaeota archaeon]
MAQQYLDHCKEILTSPRSTFKAGSKGSGLISLFGYQNNYDLREGFPLLTSKKMYSDGIIHELIWFMRGDTNIKYLEDNGVSIWRRDAFQHNISGMVEEGIFPKDLPK